MAGPTRDIIERTKRTAVRISKPLRQDDDPNRITELARGVFEFTKRIAVGIVKPLRRGDGPNKFRLSAVDTATTTHDGSEGWASRPPATFECPRCGGDILQRHARDDIDCPHCVAEFSYDESADLELKQLTCPTCRSEMVYGQRHPESFEVVEWATCNGCRYHWEFKHSYS